MNRSKAKTGKRGGRKQNPLRRRRTSNYDFWMRGLTLKYGVRMVKRLIDGYGAMLIKYGQSNSPNFMPNPSGPRQGAMLTTTQFVNQFNSSTGTSGSSNPNITQSGATAVFGAIAFTLSDLSNSGTFASLFDQYRIDRVHLSFRPRNNAVALFQASAVNQGMPKLWVVADFDDGSAPTAITDLEQYDNVAVAEGYEGIDVIIDPSITPTLWAGGAFSGYAVAGSEDVWIDIANTAVPAYGVKFGITPLVVSTTASWAWDVTARYEISFRNVR